MLRKSIIQAGCILILSAALGLGVNTVRNDGLPLVYAQKSAVQLDATKGEIALKDAAMLFISKRAVFLDARPPMAFEDGHIQGALDLPVVFFDEEFEKIAPRLKDAEVLITYCDGEHCPLSEKLAKRLKERGFSNVYVLKNGWTLWQNEELPVEMGATSFLFPASGQTRCAV